jgi:hypothetical protein
MRRLSLMWPGVVAIAAASAFAGCAARQTSAGAPHPPSQPTASGSSAGSESKTASGVQAGSEQPADAAQTPDEKRDAADRNLETSLAEFDAMLLKEQQEVAAKRAEHGTGGAAGSAGGGEGGEGEGEGAGDSGRGAAGSAGASGPRTGGGQQAGQQGEGQAAGGRTGASTREGGRGGSGGSRDRATGSSTSGGGQGGRDTSAEPEGLPPTDADSSRVPDDVGDGRDDDIVARQLREAAMAEEDPAIREKLWEEYRRYKRGGSGGGGR